MKTIAKSLAAISLAAGATAFAGGNICPASNAVGLDGIGDGCSTSVGGYFLLELGVFKETFTPACNEHDKCYTTLGATYESCNSEFLSDMQNACKDAFNPLIRPEYPACIDSSWKYYTAVQGWAEVMDPLPGFQREALGRSRSVQGKVNTDNCGTTPERTTLYTSDLIAKINGAFQSKARRLPTIYEFFDAMNSSDYVDQRAVWESNLTAKANKAVSVYPPVAGYTKSQNFDGLIFTANPIFQGNKYLWKINYSTSTTTSISVPFKKPKYDLDWRAEGFMKVTVTDPKVTDPLAQKNMKVIDVPVHEEGWCADTIFHPCDHISD